MMNGPGSTRDKTNYSVESLSDADNDKSYWRSKSVYERLQAVELMRQVVYGYQPASGRLQRVFEVAELPTR
jgi:hypothetical protein